MRIRVLLFVPAALFVVAQAQDFRATLNGSIRDAAGAPVPGAQVYLRDVDKNETQRLVADHEGNYVFPLVAPGSYEVKVTHPGFKTSTREGLTLNVNQVAAIDVTLELGSVNDTITVTADVPLLELG